MLIIDTHADNKLIKKLEAMRSQENTSTSRSIHFKLSANLVSENGVQDIVLLITTVAKKHLSLANPEMYLCEDGDIFILAPTLPIKEAKQMMLDVASSLGLPVTDALVEMSELSVQMNAVLTCVEQKIEKRRQSEEDKRKLLEKQKQERKRYAILSADTKDTSEDIKNRRVNRTAPELMIIEDDAFSRRLVENVLQKQYSLTGLGTADRALATYASLAPDILFLDIDLPDVTGHELLERIVTLDPDSYVVMLSGNADKENIMQAMNKGAKGFIAKPFTKEKLFQYIDRCPTITRK